MLSALDLVSRHFGEVSTFGEILPNEAVRVLVRAALPGGGGVSEVHLHVCIDGEAFVIAHLLALVVRERLLEFAWYGFERAHVRLAHRHGIFLSSERNQERIPSRALNEGAECRLLRFAEDEIALPMARYRAVGDLLWPLLNGEHIGYLSPFFLDGILLPLPAVRMFLPQRLHERVLQLSSREHVQVPIYGFVRNAHTRIERILPFETLLYLPGRPLLPEPLDDIRPQTSLRGEPALAASP